MVVIPGLRATLADRLAGDDEGNAAARHHPVPPTGFYGFDRPLGPDLSLDHFRPRCGANAQRRDSTGEIAQSLAQEGAIVRSIFAFDRRLHDRNSVLDV